MPNDEITKAPKPTTHELYATGHVVWESKKIEVPGHITDPDEIADYLTEKYWDANPIETEMSNLTWWFRCKKDDTPDIDVKDEPRPPTIKSTIEEQE